MNRWHSRLAELRCADASAPSAVQNVQNVQNLRRAWAFEHSEQLEQAAKSTKEAANTWTDAEEERAGIIEYDAGAPREWAEALARLHPAHPPADVTPGRWLQFIDDCGRFLDAGWADRAVVLGWHPLDLFGCDRERPFARIDRSGLLWLLNGGKLVALTQNTATIETPTRARQTYYRRPLDADHIVLAWELSRVPDKK
jgi:hypothetical protein